MAVTVMKSFGIKGIVPLSMLDWEGKLVTTVFSGGCNFRCPFCHNAQLVTGNKNLPEVAWDDISMILASKRGWVDGVCITGGEPTINSNLANLLRNIRNLGFQVKLDTNGTQPQVLKSLIDERLIDAVAVDIKTSFQKYPVATQVPNLSDRVKESIEVLSGSQDQGKFEVEFRTTVVPTIVEREDVLLIAEYLGEAGANRYTLQQFNPKTVLAPETGTIKPFAHEFLTALAQEASQFVPTYLRG